MLTTILRRGGAWRFAALGLLAASILSFGLNGPNHPETAQAHVGTPGPYCGSADIPPFAVFLGTYDWWIPEHNHWVHYHIWSFPGPSTTWYACGILL